MATAQASTPVAATAAGRRADLGAKDGYRKTCHTQAVEVAGFTALPPLRRDLIAPGGRARLRRSRGCHTAVEFRGGCRR